MSLILFDFETTGLNPFTDRITQFCFINNDTNTVLSNYCNPTIPIPQKAIELNGITNLDIEKYPTFEEQLENIIAFIGKNPYLVGHNSSNFDVAFLENAFSRACIPLINFKSIDTISLSRYFLPEIPQRNLNYLRNYYKIDTKNAHLATKDVFDLQHIYNIWSKNYTSEQMFQFSEKMLNIMNFGKYKGTNLKEIPKSYFYFMIQNDYITEYKNFDLYKRLKSIVTR